MRTRVAGLLLALIVVFNSCNDDDATVPARTGTKETIAQAIAVALDDDEFRHYIDSEARKKFDHDHDILIQRVIGDLVTPDKTFLKYLEENAPNVDVEATLDQYPLLTLFIPFFDEWETATILPSVGVVDDGDKVNVFNVFAPQREISRTVKPDFPVLVLKENERVGYTTNSTEDHDYIFNANGFYYYFLNKDQTSGIANPVAFDSKVISSYEKNCDDCMQRDFIYYGISPLDGIKEGEFDPDYNEAITSISLFNVAAFDALTQDWTEGDLELYFNVLTIDAFENPMLIQKVCYVPLNSLIEPVLNSSLRKVTSFNLETPLVIGPWRLDIYGDSWKINVSEFDPGTMVVRQMDFSTTKGSNFKEGSNGLIKIGNGFGESTGRGVGGNVDISWSERSKTLGDAMVQWFWPVIASGTDESDFEATIYTTGTVNFTLAPVKIKS